MFKIAFLLFFASNLCFGQVNNNYVTIEPIFYSSVGAQDNVKSRLGNQLLAYIKGQWAAHKLNLPYLHVHFDYDDLLKAGSAHKELKDFLSLHPNANLVTLQSVEAVKLSNSIIPILHVVDYKTKSEKKVFYHLHESLNMRSDKEFIAKIRDLLTPIKPIEIIVPPENKISVAVHVRKGGGYDQPLWSLQYFDEAILKKEAQKKYDYKKLQPYYQDMLKME